VNITIKKMTKSKVIMNIIMKKTTKKHGDHEQHHN
jgi:hypothetical protein